MMVPLKCLLAVICVLNIWIIRYARGCAAGQMKTDERCCDLCPPGEFVVTFCSKQKQTVCSPCKEGYFSNQYSAFDRCEECRSCKHDYAEKCTLTTNAKCSCRSGFLCSNDVCSECEENKCTAGEKLNKTEIPIGLGLIKYSYQCVPACPSNAYLDVKENTCKPRTQCGVFLFSGNKTHDSVCEAKAEESDGNNIYVILGIGFVLLSLHILVSLSSACIKNLRKHKSNNNPVLVVSTNTNDFHLSKEESGLQLIIQDESKDSNSCGQLANVTTV